MIDDFEDASLLFTGNAIEDRPVWEPTLPADHRSVDQIEPVLWGQAMHNMLQEATTPVFSMIAEDLRYYLRQETDFKMDPSISVAMLNQTEAESIYLGKTVCSHCQGSGYYEHPAIGVVTGIRVLWPRSCPCTPWMLYYKTVRDIKNVPLAYQDVNFTNVRSAAMRPRFKGMHDDFVNTIFAALDHWPKHMVLMTGPAGVGKTTLMCAMYDHAIRVWAYNNWLVRAGITIPSVWKITALALSIEQRNWEMRGEITDEGAAPTRVPTVTPRKVQSAFEANLYPCVFLEEFDKYKMNSPFQNAAIHALVDAVQSNYAQMVVNSNLTTNSLKLALGTSFGEAIVRRLCGGPRGLLLDFFKQEVLHNDRKVFLKNGKLYYRDSGDQVDGEGNIYGVAGVDDVVEAEVAGEPVPVVPPKVSGRESAPKAEKPKARDTRSILADLAGNTPKQEPEARLQKKAPVLKATSRPSKAKANSDTKPGAFNIEKPAGQS